MSRKFTVLLTFILWSVCATALYADDFDTARNNQLQILVGPSSFDTSDPSIAAQLATISSNAQSTWNTMETGSSRTELWSDLPFPSDDPVKLAVDVSATYNRLETMAFGYATYGASEQKDSNLLAAIIDGLTWMNNNEYSSTTTKVGDWFNWQISAPMSLDDIMVMLYPQLTSTQIATWVGAINHFTPGPFSSGANLMWSSEIVSISGVLVKDPNQVPKGANAAPNALKTVAKDNGFYADGSYIFHAPPSYAYNGGYGTGLISDFVDFATALSGTQWAFSSADTDSAIAHLYQSYQPFVYKGEMMDDVRGREISRWSDTSHSVGRKIVATYLHAATFASAADAATLLSAAKYWIHKDTTFSPDTAGFDIRTILQAESVLNDSSVTAMAEPTGFTLYPRMDRAVHLRPGWGASVAMSSSRQADYESINDENLKGWHTGDGMLYIYDGDLSQYSNNYWPTVNNYFQTGTTVVENSTQNAGQRSTSDFVGGVPSYDGIYGAAMMQLAPQGGAVSAKKAWFFLDDQVFCLGADITSSSGSAIRTVVANRALTAAGTNPVKSANGVDTSNPVAEPATWVTSTPLQYLLIAGNVTGSTYGLYFPTATSLDSMREARTGAWNDINKDPQYSANNTDYTENYYYSTINHGIGPAGSSYAYAVLPDITGADLASYASSPEVTVLENSATAQAITDSKLGVTAAVFWAASSKTVGSGTSSITSSGQAAVFVSTKASTIDLAVTDPTQSNTATIQISLGASATGVTPGYSKEITVVSTSPIVISVAPSDLAGGPALIQFTLN